MICIDLPALARGLAVEVVRGPLIVDGWAAARDGIASIDIDVDGQYVSAVSYGAAGQQFAAALPLGADADIRCFYAVVPAWALANGKRRVRVSLKTKVGRHVETDFSIRVERTISELGPGLLRRKMPLSEIQLANRILNGLAWHPHFGLLIAIGEIDEEISSARRTLISLRDQAYGAWHATIVRRGRVLPRQAAERLLDGLTGIAERVDVRLDAPAAELLADLVTMAGQGGQPDLVGILLAGDVMGCDALLEMAIASGLQPDAEFFYSDERRVSPVSNQSEAFFKPQWSPDLLTATNYIGRFWCTLPTILRRIRATMGDWFQFGDYDLVLRCTEATSGICHVPKLLCERGRPQVDHPDQERASLGRAMQRRGIDGKIEDGSVPGSYRLRRMVDALGLVSIIIPTCAAEGRIKTCIETLRSLTAYRSFEIVCVENIPAAQPNWKAWVRENADIVVPGGDTFNWSRFNNRGAQAAKGGFLLFLNDDVEIIDPDWLDALLEQAMRSDVGVVGARLLYPDRTVQHAGIFWTPRGGRHAFRGTSMAEPGYFALSLTERDVLAVTGACYMVRREAFEALGGFDESHTIVNNDVDFCLRCWERGKSVIYTPHAALIHHEATSRRDLDDIFDAEGFYRRWGRKLRDGDPFYHPFLSREGDDFAADGEPVELVYSSRPLFERAQVRNILAAKLDHIGDFVTAVPALRRLQRHFPQARLYLLAAPGVAELAELVPGLAGTIEFEFFFARSGLGQRELTDNDFRELQQRLQPYRFDLAIDLRKAPETRPVLRYSGAPWLAGFDHNGQFPWLDVVMEWETDPIAAGKRSHVSEDLLRLVDAVATAVEPNSGFDRQPMNAAQRVRSGSYPAGRKLVCIHPGVGSPIRQ
ncbi:MAG TPA: glycosyltransferase [Stellaceae bacterium]|nr:glycosyltransferase [Stellaceae bacterium]